MAKKSIVVISAETPYDQIVYVESYTAKEFGNVQVTTTFNSNQAHDFQSLEAAQQIIPKIFNPWDRKYKAHRLTIQARALTNAQTDMR